MPVINMSVISRRVSTTSPEICFCVSVVIFISYAILFSIFTGILLNVRRFTNLISFSLCLFIFFVEAAQIGINKKDIKDLDDQRIYFLQAMNDIFCGVKAV